MKTRRRKWRRPVRYLPDLSWNCPTTGQPLNAGSSYTAKGTGDIQRDVGGVPNALLTAGVTGWASSLQRERPKNLIIDHIHGKVHWGFEGNDGIEGSQDASGTFQHIVRAAIWIADVAPKTDGSGIDAISWGTETLGGTGVMTGSDGVNPFNMGSFGPEGVRVLWRRTWMVINAWTADEADAWFGSENMCPPGPYVDVKPRRLLKEDQILVFGWWTNAAPLQGATGTLRFWIGNDLRVAVHDTPRRR